MTLSLEKRAVQPASQSLEMDNRLVFCNAGKRCAMRADEGKGGKNNSEV